MSNTLLVLTIIFVSLIVIVTFIFPYIYAPVTNENFVSNYEPDIDRLLIQENKEAMGANRYMTTTQFNDMIQNLRKVIYNNIVKFSKTCRSMNGYNEPLDSQMTLVCYNDTKTIKNTILTDMGEYIIDHIKSVYSINLNPYFVLSSLSLHLDIDEDVIYPLTHTTLYTIHGVRYFTQSILRRLIDENLYINDVLYTILLHRGIEVLPDTDNQL